MKSGSRLLLNVDKTRNNKEIYTMSQNASILFGRHTNHLFSFVKTTVATILLQTTLMVFILYYFHVA